MLHISLESRRPVLRLKGRYVRRQITLRDAEERCKLPQREAPAVCRFRLILFTGTLIYYYYYYYFYTLGSKDPRVKSSKKVKIKSWSG